jgi:hypothetical protein
MKLNELILNFEIQTSNEERQLLHRFDGVLLPEVFTDREQTIIENLIRKSLVSKIGHRGKTYLVKNERHL